MDILEKKELRQGKLDELKGLINTKNERETPEYTEDEVKRFNTLEGEIEKLDNEIEQLEKEEKFLAKRNVKPTAKKSEEEKVAENFSFSEAVRQAATGNLEGIYKELDEEGRSEAVASGAGVQSGGIVIPEFALRADAQNTVTAGTQPADGANLVPQDRRGFIQNLYDRTILNAAGVTMLNGLQGNVEMPTEASVVSSAWATEIETLETQKATFGEQTMSPNRLGVAVAYSTQLLRQSSPSIDAVMRRQIDEAISQKLDEAFINGNGGNIGGLQGDITGALTETAFNYALLVEIIKFQAESNRYGNFRVISSPKAMAELMDTYRNDTGTGAPLLQGDTLASGMPFLVSNKVSDVLGAGNDETAIYAGDFSDVYVGAWGGIQLIVDPYSRAKSAQTEIVVNSFWDMHNTRPDKMVKTSIAIA